MRLHAKAVIATAVMLLTLALGVTFAGAASPVVSLDPTITNVSFTGAHATGTVDPQDQETYYFFQYSKDPEVEGWSYGPLGGPLAPGSGSTSVEADLTELEAGNEYFVRLLAIAEPSGEEVASPAPYPSFTTPPVDAPTVTMDPVTSITDETAHFSATINPNSPTGNPSAYDVKWHFECTPECPGLPDNQRIEVFYPVVPADSSNHTVSVDVKDLEPNTEYEVRLVADNAGPPVTVQVSFKTVGPAPVVNTLPPAVITDTSAWIGGLVNPRNSATTYYIEYSTDPSFATSTSVPPTQDRSAGSGNQRVFDNYHAQGLTPNTAYYYRVVATGASTTFGETESFTTLAQPLPVPQGLPEGRVYEKVSPAEKNGGDVAAANASGPYGFGQSLATAYAGGDAVLYSSRIPFAGKSGALANSYLARRTAQGWTSKGITPRMDVEPAGLANSAYLPWISDDFSRWLVATPAVLNPGDPSRVHNNYLYQESTGTYESIPVPGVGDESSARPEGISGDEQHVILSAPGGTLWEWDGSQTKRVDVLPEGTPFSREQSYFGDDETAGANAVSADGSRVFFKVRASNNEESGVYLRKFNGESASSVHVSGSERTGEDSLAQQPATFELASPDGSVAFFTSTRPLTDESELDPEFGSFNSPTLYRWDADAPEGERLTDITSPGSGGRPGVLGTVGANEDATVVYFTATGKLTPEATKGMANLYEWREDTGELEFIAGLRAPPPGSGGPAGDNPAWADEAFGGYRQARVSPDGRYLSFLSRESLTAYDVNDTRQLYLYDNQADRITCVSCSTVEPKSRRNTWISTRALAIEEEGERVGDKGGNMFGFLTENMSPDGSRIIFDSKDALVPGDSNGQLDVYQWRNGALSLISTGDSSVAIRLLDHSADAKDIFFATPQRLVPSDVDNSWDLYDARVGGVAERVERAPCVGDECQGTPSPLPTFVTPGSAAYRGTGNVKSQRVACAKAKVRRKGKCVAKKKAKKAAKEKAAKKARQARNGRNG